MPKGFLKQRILLNQLKAQDPQAFAEFYDQYVSRIYRFIFFKVSSVSDAQDLTSEVFLKTWQYLKESPQEEIKNLSAWVYRLARNTVIDWYRQQNKQPLSLETQAEEAVLETPGEKFNVDWEITQVQQALFRLKDEYREALVLRFLDELEISEVAKALEKSPGAIRVLLHRALKALQVILTNQDER